jgi:hypothetical protein
MTRAGRWLSPLIVVFGLWLIAFATGFGILTDESVMANVGLRTCNYLVATGTEARVVYDGREQCSTIRVLE